MILRVGDRQFHTWTAATWNVQLLTEKCLVQGTTNNAIETDRKRRSMFWKLIANVVPCSGNWSQTSFHVLVWNRMDQIGEIGPKPPKNSSCKADSILRKIWQIFSRSDGCSDEASPWPVTHLAPTEFAKRASCFSRRMQRFSSRHSWSNDKSGGSLHDVEPTCSEWQWLRRHTIVQNHEQIAQSSSGKLPQQDLSIHPQTL